MTEHELRLLVREAIAKQKAVGSQSRDADWANIMTPDPISFGQLHVPSGSDACLIEPSVPCNHCGYCKSYGH